MYKLHYASLDLKGGIPCHEFELIDELRTFIGHIVYPLKMVNDKIYLVAFQDEIIVTENGLLVEELFEFNLNSVYPFYEDEDIFIQEYHSYEEAYRVALMMKEVSPLCYEHKENETSR